VGAALILQVLVNFVLTAVINNSKHTGLLPLPGVIVIGCVVIVI